MQTNPARSFSFLTRLKPFLVGGMAFCVCILWLPKSLKNVSSTSTNVHAKPQEQQGVVSKTIIENNISKSNFALEKMRHDSVVGQKQALEQSRRWANDAVLAGHELARVSKYGCTPGKSVVRAEGDDGTAQIMQVSDVAVTKKVSAVAPTRTNVAQSQSRSLYGALALNDNQWREVDRMLAAYYQEGCARRLNADACPSTGTDGWQEQRADLSRHAFSAINARLTAEQSAQFCRIYQADSWLWAANPCM